MKPYEIIQKLESDNSRLFKEEVILNTALHQYEFVSGAKLALDPYTTFGIKQIPISKENGPGLSWAQFTELTTKLANRSATGNEAKDLIDFHMTLATQDEWNFWYRRILLKDLKCGVSEKTLNKCGIEIPRFQCMLASNGENNKHMKGKCLVEAKYDGVRALVIVKNNVATIYSRNGKQLVNFPHIEKAFSREDLNDMVFDGEIMSNNFQSLMKQIHRKTDAKTEDAFLALFDGIHLSEFNAGKSTDTLLERKEMLEIVYNKLIYDPSVELVDYIEIDLDTEYDKFKALNKEALENGYEGLMVKPIDGVYECKRSNLWFKIKPFIEVTLSIVSVEEGQGRFEGTTGAIICEGEDEGVFIKVNCGGGLSDKQRNDIWKNKEEMIGQLVEIKADSISQNEDGNHSLRFPRFKTFRGFTPGEKL